MLNEKGLAACMRAAWKGRGYTVLADDGEYFLNAKTWGVFCIKEAFPRNCLGLLATHLGALPENGECWMLQKDAGAQKQLFEDTMGVLEKLNASLQQESSRICQTPLTLFGLEVWQNQRNMETFCVCDEYSRIIDADTRSSGGLLTQVNGNPTLLFSAGEGLAFVIPRTRGEESLLGQLDGFPWCGDLA